MSEEVQKDEIKASYDFKDFEDGRAFPGPDGTMVDRYYDYRAQHKEVGNKSEFEKVSAGFPAQELQKIAERQREIYAESVRGMASNMIRPFLEAYHKATDKAAYIQSNLDKVEEVFNEHKYPLSYFQGRERDFGQGWFMALDIETIRNMHRESEYKDKRALTYTLPSKCFFRFSPAHNHQMDTMRIKIAAYFRFYQWLMEYKKQTEVVAQFKKQPNAGGAVNEFYFLEKLVSSMVVPELTWLFALEKNILNRQEMMAERKKKDYSALEKEHEYFHNVFKEEVARVKHAVKAHTYLLPTQPEKAGYINQVYIHLNGLAKANGEMMQHWKEIEKDKISEGHRWDSNFMQYAMYYGELLVFQRDIRNDFKDYLDPELLYNTDEKIFEHSILCQYSDKHAKIYGKQHEPGCKHLEYTLEQLAEMPDEFKKDYLEQYDYIVSKWVKKNREKHNDVTEVNFINGQIRRLDTLFTFDKEAKTFSATDYRQHTFIFKEEFYHKNLAKVFSFIKSHLQNRLQELNASTTPVVKVSPDNKRKAERVNSFSYKHFPTNSGAITTLHGTMIKGWIAETTSVKDFKAIFSNQIPEDKIVWLKSKAALRCFIRMLKKKGLITGSKMWKAAQQVFIINDDKTYNIEGLAKLKDPDDKKLVSEINVIVNTLMP